MKTGLLKPEFMLTENRSGSAGVILLLLTTVMISSLSLSLKINCRFQHS